MGEGNLSTMRPLAAAVGPVMAVYQPREDSILVVVDHSGNAKGVTLTLAEARAIHGAIGGALALADHRSDPVGAVL